MGGAGSEAGSGRARGGVKPGGRVVDLSHQTIAIFWALSFFFFWVWVLHRRSARGTRVDGPDGRIEVDVAGQGVVSRR